MRALAILAILCGLTLASGLIPPRPSARAAQTAPAQAGVVIRFGDGTTYQACVDLGPDGQASGEEVLRASGLALITAYEPGAGAAVCKIEQEGCNYPGEGCFCQCSLAPGQPCRYWAYYHLGESGWAISNIGANSYTVRAGAVEGWSWGPGGVGSGVEPPPVSFGDICALPATATATATLTPSATATATLTPSATATPTATATPPAQPAAPQPIIVPVPSNTPRATATATIPPPTSSASATAIPTDTPTATPTDTAQPPTTTPEPPSATPEPQVVAATSPATPVAAAVAATQADPPTPQAAGGSAATPTAGPLMLPLVIHSGAIPTRGPQLAPLAQPTHTPAPEALVATAPATPDRTTPQAEAAAPGGGYLWFLALSAGLALLLTIVRIRRGA